MEIFLVIIFAGVVALAVYARGEAKKHQTSAGAGAY